MDKEYVEKLLDAAKKVLAAPRVDEKSLLVDAEALRELLLVVQEYRR